MKVVKIRRKMKKPTFKRQVSYSRVKMNEKWRAPKGIHSKQRMHIKHKGFIPSPGYGSPKSIRGLHPCGLSEVLVSNIKQLETMDAGKECIRISATLGKKKRTELVAKAKEMKIKVLNPTKKYKEKAKKAKKPLEKAEENKEAPKEEKPEPKEAKPEVKPEEKK